jgi:RNA-dependent RNA polymerase
MLLAGHQTDEPFLHKLLVTIQKMSLKSIEERAKIFIPKSRMLLGVCDPLSKLKSGEVFIQISTGNTSFVLTGPVAVCKNPCVHPGGTPR